MVEKEKDIVERLRRRARECFDPYVNEFNDAADEIENEREARERQAQSIREQREEIERLRQAIKEIGALADVDADNRGWMARTALGQERCKEVEEKFPRQQELDNFVNKLRHGSETS